MLILMFTTETYSYLCCKHLSFLTHLMPHELFNPFGCLYLIFFPNGKGQVPIWVLQIDLSPLTVSKKQRWILRTGGIPPILHYYFIFILAFSV